jgi:hypothetical protein
MSPRAALGAAVVGVAVEDGVRRVAGDRLLQPAAFEEGEDLQRLSPSTVARMGEECGMLIRWGILSRTSDDPNLSASTRAF